MSVFKKTMPKALVLALVLLLSNALNAAGTNVEEVRLSVRIVPQPVMSAGNVQIVYEVHIENSGEYDLKALRLAVFRKPDDQQPFQVLEGKTLLANMEFFDKSYRGAGRDYLRDAEDDPQSIGPTMIGVVYMWLTLNETPKFPDNWYHEVTLNRKDSAGSQIRFSGAEFTLSSTPAPTIGPPLEGGPWWVMESMANTAVHRRAMVLEMPLISQRFGADYIMLGESGSSIMGDDPEKDMGDVNQWYGYGQNVLAVADGFVADVLDGLPDNIPGSGEKAVPNAKDTINGNYVVLDIGAGRYAAYAHLAPGSIKVSLGQRVRQGDIIGKLGNTGNSGGPHLHFHVSTGNHIFDAEGLPFVYDSFESVGTVSLEQLRTVGFHAGDEVARACKGEIPSHNSVIVFPAAEPGRQ